MGWFLPWRRKQARRARRTGQVRRHLSLRQWDAQRTLLGLKVVGVVAVVVVLGFGGRAMEAGLANYAAGRAGVAAAGAEVILADAPAWMGQAVRAQLTRAVASQLRCDPLAGGSLQAATAALASQPWVGEVKQIRRLVGGVVVVEADYRQPIALVQCADGFRLIDSEGYCLPGLYLDHQVRLVGLPIVVGVATLPPPPGRIWSSEGLDAGLILIQLIGGESFADQIRWFDVGRRDRAGRIRLVLHSGSGEVRWGYAPGQERAIEVDAAVKIQRLKRLDQTYGSINGGSNVIEVFGPAIVGDEPFAHSRVTPAGSYENHQIINH